MLVKGRNEDNRGHRFNADRAHDSESVQTGHLHVEKYQIGTERTYVGDGFGTV
jgi:hypothetical protein